MKTTFKAGDVLGQWTLIAMINSSANGYIFACHNSNDEKAIIKICKKITSKSFYRFGIEIKSLIEASDIETVVDLIDYKLPPNKFNGKKKTIPYHVLPRGIDFLKYLKDEPLTKKIEYLLIIAYSLFQLHKIEIYHRDIKPTNIIVHENMPYLIDFGIAKIKESIEITGNNPIGPKFTMAPEIETATKESRKNIDWIKADIYSLAITIWITLTNEVKGFEGQYFRNSDISLSNFIEDDNIFLLHEALEKSTAINPDVRCNLEELIITLLKWTDIQNKYFESKYLQWNQVITNLFNFKTPISSKWTDYDTIFSILKSLVASTDLCHLSLPTSGGMDLVDVQKERKKEIALVMPEGEKHLIVPKSLEFVSFKEKPSRQFFLLRLKKRKKLTINHSEDTKFYQWAYTNKERTKYFGNFDSKVETHDEKLYSICFWRKGILMITGNANAMSTSGVNYLGFGKSKKTEDIKNRFTKLMEKK